MPHDLHGKVIHQSNLKNYCKDRNQFVDKDAHEKFLQDFRAKKPLAFLPTAIRELHVQDGAYEKSKYKLALYGIFADGSKTCVMLSGIKPYFNIKLKYAREDGMPNQAADTALINQEVQSITAILQNRIGYESGKCPFRTSVFQAKPFKIYQEYQSNYLKLEFDKLFDRKRALQTCIGLGWELTADDTSNFHRVVCRDKQITISQWSIITGYVVKNINQTRIPVFDVNIDNYKPYPTDVEMPIHMKKDKSIVLAWDIETYSSDGDIPSPLRSTDCIFCIGCTFHTTYSAAPFLRVALVDYPSAPIPDCLVVYCDNEASILRTFAQLVGTIRPDIIMGFNDSDYDWPWVIERAKKTPGLVKQMISSMSLGSVANDIDDDILLRWTYLASTIKVDAQTNADGRALWLDGFVPLDVRTCFRRNMPNEPKSSLAHYLKRQNLGTKDDMPYQRMFAIYREYQAFVKAIKSHDPSVNLGDLSIPSDFEYTCMHSTVDHPETPAEIHARLMKEMADVLHYCVVDAQKCQELMVKTNVIGDYRELSNMAFCSFSDSVYRANGMKVRNYVIAYGQRAPFNIQFSNRSVGRRSNGKYPGAFVFPPIRGLNTLKLTFEERRKKARQLARLDLDTINKVQPQYKVEKYPGGDKNKIDRFVRQIAPMDEDSIAEYRRKRPSFEGNLPSEYDRQYNCMEWIDMTDDEANKFREFVAEHGAYHTMNEIQTLKEKVDVHPLLEQFLLERIGRPIAGLDYASLYPSLIMTYNFSPEYCIIDKNKAREIGKKHRLERVSFKFGREDIRGWFVWHNNAFDPTDPKFKFGIYPYLLRGLFNARKSIKATLKPYDKRKEEMVALGPEYIANNAAEFDDVIFNYNYYNAKQKAAKVFMNTFYGEAGNQISPFFLIQVAGGITSAGKRNIKYAGNVVQDNDYNIYYGDTDSMYIAPPDALFEQLDRDYYSGKIDKQYCHDQTVLIAMEAMEKIKNIVNEQLSIDNGTKFLTMAYEEVLYPSMFHAKKKYNGIAHVSVVNTTPIEIFIRGLDVIKRGNSDFMRNNFMSILWESMRLDNLYTVLELVQHRIDHIYHAKWPVEYFIQSDMYRPNRNNVKVHTFVSRMREVGVEIPANERFNYIMVKKYPYRYNTRGIKTDISVGDKMELVEVALRQGMEVDMDYYMKGSVNGQLARAITYHDMFYVEPTDETQDDIKIADDAIYKLCQKYIDSYCQRYYTTYKQIGQVYKHIYSRVESALLECYDGDKLMSQIMQQSIRANRNASAAHLNSGRQQVYDEIEASVEKEATRMTKKYMKKWTEDTFGGLNRKQQAKESNRLQTIYFGSGAKSIDVTSRAEYERESYAIKLECDALLADIMKIVQINSSNVSRYTDLIRDNLTGQIDTNNQVKNIEKKMTKEEVDSAKTTIDNIMDSLQVRSVVQNDFHNIFENSAYKNIMENIKQTLNRMLEIKVKRKQVELITEYLRANRDASCGLPPDIPYEEPDPDDEFEPIDGL